MTMNKTLRDENFDRVPEAQRTVIVPKQTGLRQKIVQRVVRAAQRFQSDILLRVGSLVVDAKSSLTALMFLGALNSQPVVVVARGVDSNQAAQALYEAFQIEPMENTGIQVPDLPSESEDEENDDDDALASQSREFPVSIAV